MIRVEDAYLGEYWLWELDKAPCPSIQVSLRLRVSSWVRPGTVRLWARVTLADEKLVDMFLAAMGLLDSRDSSLLSFCPYWYGPEFKGLFDTVICVTKVIVTCNSTGSQPFLPLGQKAGSWFLMNDVILGSWEGITRKSIY